MAAYKIYSILGPQLSRQMTLSDDTNSDATRCRSSGGTFCKRLRPMGYSAAVASKYTTSSVRSVECDLTIHAPNRRAGR